jgi:hypothetical protein
LLVPQALTMVCLALAVIGKAVALVGERLGFSPGLLALLRGNIAQLGGEVAIRGGGVTFACFTLPSAQLVGVEAAVRGPWEQQAIIGDAVALIGDVVALIGGAVTLLAHDRPSSVLPPSRCLGTIHDARSAQAPVC